MSLECTLETTQSASRPKIQLDFKTGIPCQRGDPAKRPMDVGVGAGAVEFGNGLRLPSRLIRTSSQTFCIPVFHKTFLMVSTTFFWVARGLRSPELHTDQVLCKSKSCCLKDNLDALGTKRSLVCPNLFFFFLLETGFNSGYASGFRVIAWIVKTNLITVW
jgi:hypothetical protein